MVSKHTQQRRNSPPLNLSFLDTTADMVEKGQRLSVAILVYSSRVTRLDGPAAIALGLGAILRRTCRASISSDERR